MVCTNPPKIDNGHVSHTNSFDSERFDGTAKGWLDGQKIEYKCYRHYALYDEYRMKCNSGKWEGDTIAKVFPKCKYSLATESKFKH